MAQPTNAPAPTTPTTPTIISPAAAPSPAARPAPPAGPVSPAHLWPRLLEAAQSNRRLRLVLDEMSLVSVADDIVTLRVSDAMRSAAVTLQRDLVQLLSNLLDRSITVALAETQPQATAEAPTAPVTRAPVTDHPLVKQAMELFGAKVIRVQPRADTGSAPTETRP